MICRDGRSDKCDILIHSQMPWETPYFCIAPKPEETGLVTQNTWLLSEHQLHIEPNEIMQNVKVIYKFTRGN